MSALEQQVADLVLENKEKEDSDDEVDTDAVAGEDAAAAKARRNKKKKDKKKAKKVAQLFKGKAFPQGQIMEHAGDFNTYRMSSEEKRALERFDTDRVQNLREAAEVHRTVRKYAQSIIKPGVKLVDMCEQIENMNRKLVAENGKERGIAFPTGCSLNHVAAHYTPNPGDDTCLGAGDVMKVDFGTQINGHIIDCAWTVSFDPTYDELLAAVKASTEAGIKAAGIDVRLGEIGAIIQEVMESYEVTLTASPTGVYGSATAAAGIPSWGSGYVGSTFTGHVKPLRNLNGHNILPWKIHGGKSVPIVKNGDMTKMEEGELYACETFGSVGPTARGEVHEDLECSHYMRNWDVEHAPLRLDRSRQLLKHVEKTFGNLAFCRRWLEQPDGGSVAVHGNNGKQERYLGALKNLCDVGLISSFPPLVEPKGSYTAQYEHTFLLRPTCKEVFSRGDDY